MAPVLRNILVSLLASFMLLLAPATALGAQPKNYWLLSSAGQVFAYGKARSYGTEYRKRHRGTITGIKGTADGKGYWIVTGKTHYGFGDARRYKYRAGGLKKYTGKVRPKGLKGRIVGYATARIPTTKTSSGGGTHTTTGTTTTPTTPTVNCSNASIQTSGLSAATASDPYSQTLSAGGVSGGTWSWRIDSGNLPSGLVLSSTGMISGTPEQSTAGTQSTFTVQATNSQCPSHPATETLTLAVAVPPMSITTTSLPDGTYGQAYSQTLQVTGGQPGDYQWSATGWQWSNTGLSLSTSGVLSGTVQTAGTYNVTLTVADSTGATPPVSVTIPITFSYPPLQITSPTSLSGGQATTPYSSITFSATGGSPMSAPAQDQAALYEWSATGLPPGLSMTVHGVLSGTPTTPGSYDPQITVTDPQGAVPALTVAYPITIANAPLQFTTTTLTAIQGQSYSGSVIAQGGQAPYTMYRLAGSLPTGMTFNNGTITVSSSVASGDYQFTIGVTDSPSNPATAQETFNMWVAPSEVTPDLNVGSSTSDSIWSGYVEQGTSGFTSVSGTLTVPEVNASPSKTLYSWVGIDGYGTNNLIQAGVNSIASNNNALHQAWWTTVGPQGSAQNATDNEFSPAPGDTINVNIWQLTPGQWEVSLNDLSSGQGFATQVSYTGTDDTAEWIVETPSGSPATGYASTSTFSNLAASQAGSGMLELSTTGATPSSLTSSGFSISDYN